MRLELRVQRGGRSIIIIEVATGLRSGMDSVEVIPSSVDVGKVIITLSLYSLSVFVGNES